MTVLDASRHQSLGVDPAVLATALQTEVASLLTPVEWAEDEIAAASRRHPGQADLLFHTFGLLKSRNIGSGMGTEFVYRGHARELLERVAADTDLRPATAAEICLLLSKVSLQVPIHGAGAGLYFRMGQAAFGDHPLFAELMGDQSAYQQLHGSEIDELEAMLRRKAADPARQLGGIQCRGLHHGSRVTCRFGNS
ncbi:hypothetical protein Q0Z83_110790 [Actinoplanes sichuanensis]|uniref:Uncharacterized protein n=1 Tax=Actinoplanes sichuanensis TaxID=512349 RepID=A0ABW4A2A3_9ACTN|nr:hypothetical protein [Actinoplanes sichuanensis]BEL12888.1 hypothetical protein Q0Z83_110790 [Actinoplanes sichuanensis]